MRSEAEEAREKLSDHNSPKHWYGMFTQVDILKHQSIAVGGAAVNQGKGKVTIHPLKKAACHTHLTSRLNVSYVCSIHGL